MIPAKVKEVNTQHELINNQQGPATLCWMVSYVSAYIWEIWRVRNKKKN